MPPTRSVLIVDQSRESREVLRAVLECRGMRILEAEERRGGMEMARTMQPDLIVLDLEVEEVEAETASGDDSQDYDQPAGGRHTPVIVLGTARRVARDVPRGQFVSKPYHYGPLIRKIEQLLEATPQPAAT